MSNQDVDMGADQKAADFFGVTFSIVRRHASSDRNTESESTAINSYRKMKTTR